VSEFPCSWYFAFYYVFWHVFFWGEILENSARQPNVEVTRAYRWRDSCPAGGVTEERIGSDDWLGTFINDDLMMRNKLVERHEETLRAWGDDRNVSIFAGKRPNCIHRFPPRKHGNFDPVIPFSAKYCRAMKATQLAKLWKNVIVEMRRIDRLALLSRNTSPKTYDHSALMPNVAVIRANNGATCAPHKACLRQASDTTIGSVASSFPWHHIDHSARARIKVAHVAAEI